MTTDSSIHIDSSATLPDGYTQRALTVDDAEAAAHLHNVAYQARGEDETFTAEMFLRWWEDPHWDMATSSQVFFNPQGEMIGYLIESHYYNPTHPNIGWELIIDDQWQTVLRVMMAWGEQHALPALELCQPEERFAPATGCNAETPEQTFLESLGYAATRYFYRMGITFQEAPTAQDLPEGFTLKTFQYPADLEALAMAQDDMWRDHYGYIEHPSSEIISRWKDRVEKTPKFDPTMWYIATDNATGEIAGLVLCDPEDETKTDQGYIGIVGVRRAYRKRGLAQTMMSQAFAEFWRRGQKTVCLGVDGSSITGATRLYERVGMSVVARYVRMEKEMRPGVERMNVGH
jgi:mycothiol synthase